ncbi:MAG: TraB/VirB10 family protein [Alphaproteobacteria bacterium]|nr:TraB/VirB10 family protein [Alphaproteobacteria bacterium]
MLWREQIKERISSWIPHGIGTNFFHPESPQNVRRLQFFWLGCGGLIIVAFSYGIGTFLFEKTPLSKQEEAFKVTPISIETATKKVNMDEVFRNKIEDTLKQLSDKFTGLESLVLEGIKREESPPREGSHQDGFLQPMNEEGDAQPLDPSLSKDQFNQELQNKIAHLEEQVAMSRNNGLPVQPMYPQGGQGEENGSLIQKVSLSLSENLKHKLPKTVKTTIPAGAFAKTVLLSGLDASSSMTASSDPRPMLLRLIDPGTLPRRFQGDLKDCHCTASAYGDLSSERVYARLEKLTCIERTTGEIIETQVAGYIAGSDGKAGVRGVVASKDGQFLARSLVGGIFAGLSNVANPQNRQAQVNPFALGGKQPSPPNIGDMFTAGMASGATTALDRLSQYYIDRAEQLQPVIQIAAGQVVDIVFTEGTFIGSQDVKEQIEEQRDSHQSSEISHQK